MQHSASQEPGSLLNSQNSRGTADSASVHPDSVRRVAKLWRRVVQPSHCPAAEIQGFKAAVRRSSVQQLPIVVLLGFGGAHWRLLRGGIWLTRGDGIGMPTRPKLSTFSGL